jgi:hypothetical protein
VPIGKRGKESLVYSCFHELGGWKAKAKRLPELTPVAGQEKQHSIVAVEEHGPFSERATQFQEIAESTWWIAW